MPRPMGKLRIMMSARVLFNLEEADSYFDPKNKTPYREFMNDHVNDPLDIGPCFNMAFFLLKLNQLPHNSGEPPVELQVIAKDEQDTVLRILNSLEHHGLSPNMLQFTSGKPISAAYHKSFQTDFFLSRNHDDVQCAINRRIPATQMLFPKGMTYQKSEKEAFHWWTDGDAVAFGDSAEHTFQTLNRDVTKYMRHEFSKKAEPIEAGSHTPILQKITALNRAYEEEFETCPIHLWLLTARGGDAMYRALGTATHHGIWFNGGSLGLSGASKADTLQAFAEDGWVDFFADDQIVHSGPVADSGIPSGIVPYPEGSPMYLWKLEKERRTQDDTPQPV